MERVDWREINKLDEELLFLAEDGGTLELNRYQAGLLIQCLRLVQALRFILPNDD